ncbi:MAG: DNA polymerase III subunit alpha [Candidatus Dependentiae bacterium]|nr:DNA polymerase III subunit alpha [Candidatus Dependentiae bacterium]
MSIISQQFAHLHLHTDYSLLDGAIHIDKALDFCVQNGLKSMAITDHGNIFGAVKFFQQAKKKGIKPILGMEAYITEDASIKNPQNKYYHLILLVQDKQGYHNLCKLISFSYQKGFYFKPRIDYNILALHSEGLIATSACLGGHIPKLLMQGQEQEALKRIDWFVDTFGPDRFYLEVQPEDQAEQKILNQKLYEISAARNIPLVATGDCHYVLAQDREAHEVMLAIQTHDQVSSHDRYTFGDCRVHMRTAQEMCQEFKGHESAVWNTGKIADMCNFSFETDRLFFPTFAIPEAHTPETYFKMLCQSGLDDLISKGFIDISNRIQYQERLHTEITLITNMGFVGYFLVVSDFIKWAHRTGIPVGPGRGSAAGSLVAWALEITNIDPLKYNLLFERFLNPERVSMPDIDIDFCIEGRDRVIEYVRDKYGHDKVCNIITFGTMLAKGVIKDVARALGFSFEDSNAITGLIPEQLKITLKEALELEPRLQELINNNPKAKHLFDIAFKLEGLTRHASKHAAGIVISPEAIEDVLPVYVPSKSTELVTQYAMSELESIGFLKIDFLGLKNLTLIDRVVQLVKKNHDIAIDMNRLPLDDVKTFVLICLGNTSGVFQLESTGLKDVLRKLQPEKFEDIIAVNALYRPGPLGSGMVDDFIERRHGRQKIQYLFPELEPILAETYGVIVYQEQVMKIASAIGGYSLGQADLLRRAMGKKKADEMAQQKALFLAGAVGRLFDEQKATELFDLMAYFAGYGFNKSHSAAYALIAYQTAYLKAHFPAEFMAYLISLEVNVTEKMADYLQEAKDMGLSILPPDINASEIDFSVVDGSILFGLAGIKSVGAAAIESILVERHKEPFKDILDFCKRIDLRTSNKRVIEHLIYAGAFDTLAGNRAQKVASIGHVMELAAAYKKDALTGQMDLFNGVAKKEHESYVFESIAEWPDRDKLEKEKEVIGFYLSSHPLETYSHQLKWFKVSTFGQAAKQAAEYNGEHELMVTACGLLKNKKEIITKKGDRMAFVQLEGIDGMAEIILFPKTFARVSQWLDTHHVFMIKGVLDLTSSKCKIKADQCVPIELVLQEWKSIARISFELPSMITEQAVALLKNQLVKGTVPMECVVHENGKKLHIRTQQRISLDQEMVAAIEKMNIAVSISL